ncbi:phosphate transporter PHO1 homolog 3-like [Punica granatum]|uniref:Phosphate transporter PHO1 homolog 3-like n=1 Tax=Punica granatum TaxID=22663 RepID=A0A6P8DWR1_PUNGR|nr:phosphate transporter PHO1 homolog 3-like [Punica granatum]
MKFGKEFASQMVPKWQEAYMDYSYLKAVLKDVLNIRKRVQTVSPKASTPGGSALKRGVSLHRAFSGITSRHRRNPNSPLARGGDEEVLFNSVRENGSSSGARNQTTFLMSSEEGGECELVFFRRLNDEFNKVVMLYRKKVQEVVEEADELTRQMNAHVRFQARNHAGVSELELPQDCTANLLGRTATMAAIQEGEMSGEEQVEGESRGSTENPTSPSAGRVEEIGGENDAGICRVLPKASASEELLFRIFDMQSFPNQLAFSKIMKKYDKIALRSASKPYLKMVDSSYLGSSDEVIFIAYEITDCSFFGCMLALIAAIVVVIHTRDIFNGSGRFQYTDKYMDSIFRLYSLYGFIVLHMFMYAGNIYFWRRYRINYSFIFGFKQGTELGYREVLLLGFGLAILTLAGVLSNLDMEMDPKTQEFQALTEIDPLALLLAWMISTLISFSQFKPSIKLLIANFKS